VEVAPVSAGSEWKGRTSKEVMALQTMVPMDAAVILSPSRMTAPALRFLAAEAAWICSGDNRVATIAPYSRKIRSFSDDGRRFFGAYGPKFIEQLSYAVHTLATDPGSRQAVISIWREQPPATKDTPCTLSWQFLVRDHHLHCVATMRSSDLWTGWPFDVFNFSMAAAVVALELRLVGGWWRDLKLGHLCLTAGSQHLYKLDWEPALKLLASDAEMRAERYEVKQLDLDDFKTPDELVDHLWALAGKGGSGHQFLTEEHLWQE
jgi:thymidylate synthase